VRGWAALAPTLGRVLALVLATAAPARALELQSPRFTRSQMELARTGHAHFTLVYGTLEPGAAPVLHAQAEVLARQLAGGDSARVLSDHAALAGDLATGPLVLLGSARQNEWTRRLAPALPVAFTSAGFRWRGTAYERADERLQLAWPNPLAPRQVLLLIAANSSTPPGPRAGLFLGGCQPQGQSQIDELPRCGGARWKRQRFNELRLHCRDRGHRASYRCCGCKA